MDRRPVSALKPAGEGSPLRLQALPSGGQRRARLDVPCDRSSAQGSFPPL